MINVLKINCGFLPIKQSNPFFCFVDDAFLRQKDYVRALLICLQAVEKNQPALLTDIHPALVSHLLMELVGWLVVFSVPLTANVI